MKPVINIPNLPGLIRVLRYLFVLISGLFVSSLPVQSQFRTSADFIIGLGFSDYLHTGARIQVAQQQQIGVYFGSFPSLNGIPLALSSDISWHFTGEDRNLVMKPWFARFNLLYLDLPNRNSGNQYLYAGLCLGYELFPAQNIGIGIDAGPMVRLYEFSGNHGGGEWAYDRIIPSLRLQVYYRTLKYKSWLRKRS